MGRRKSEPVLKIGNVAWYGNGMYVWCPPTKKDKKYMFIKWLRNTLKAAEEHSKAISEMELSNEKEAKRYLELLQTVVVDTLDEVEGKCHR